jgi:transposase, IS5 family
MKPRDSQAKSLQANLFQSRLDQEFDPKHPLFRLAQQIDWNYFEQEFGSFHSEEMRPFGEAS